MYLILLLLGLIATAAGGAALVFGAQHNGFDLGNTLIIAGTTALLGGLILIALAQAVRQLRRIAEGLAVRAEGRMARESYEPAPAGARPAPGRIPFPPKPEPRPRPAAAVAATAAAVAAAAVPSPEPRLAVAPRLDAPEEPLDQPSPAFAASEPEPRIAPEPEEVPPLSPQPGPHFTAPAGEKDELAEDLLATAFSRLDVALRRGAEPEEPRQDAVAEEEVPPEFRDAFEPEPTLPPEVATLEPEPGLEASQQEEEEREEEPYAVSILKSGVVDGMAYTLYSDGSIEAEMPQGTMRFASIVELRAYLDQSSS